MATDYYDVLGVNRQASESDIKQAYRKLARTHHPDVASDKTSAEARFKEINEAYSILSDPGKRQAYDRFGHAGVNGNGGGAGDFSGFGGGGTEGFGDIFDMFFGNMRGGAGTTATRPNGPQRGADLRYDLEISLEEAYGGIEQEITFNHLTSCETCKGSGAKPGTLVVSCDRCSGSGMQRSVRQTPLGQFVTQTPCTKCNGEGHTVPTPCETCRGRGRVERRRTMTIKIPAGVDDGSRIRIGNHGEAGARGGPPGDLYVYLTIAHHAIFVRDGMDLSIKYPISFPQAALGGEVEVPAISGEMLRLDITPGTQNNTRYRLRGQGMPGVRGGGFGDLYVHVLVAVPTQLTKRERELLEELSSLNGESVDERSFFERVKDAFRAE